MENEGKSSLTHIDDDIAENGSYNFLVGRLALEILFMD
jgi:hypothetical protein